jgi:hypothetical protein
MLHPIFRGATEEDSLHDRRYALIHLMHAQEGLKMSISTNECSPTHSLR